MSTITVTIGGVDKTTALLAESLYIRLGINNQGTVCQFTISGAGGYVPAAWDEVTVTVDSVAVFGGYITSRDAARAGVDTSARLHWSVECRDYSALFDRLIVSAQYKSTTDKSIIGQLFATYLSGEGFDASTNVPALAYGISIGFERQTLRTALNTLAKQLNCAWYVDSNKALYWFKTYDPPTAAFDIDTESPNNSTTFNVMDMRRRIDDTARVNRITVIGGGVKAAAVVTESFAADGTIDTFGPLTKQPHTVLRVQLPTAQIPARYIGMEPDATLYYDTGTPPYIQALFNRESRTFRIRDLSGNPPLEGTVYVTYFPVTALTVTVDDTDAQATLGRVFEQEVYRPDLTNAMAAENFGLTMLERLANERETITFDIARPGLIPGTMIDVTSSSMDVDVPEYNYLLLENGDNWLLEDGRGVLLESSVIAGRYLIQDVNYRPVTTGNNEWLVIASVSCGEYQRSLLDTLAQTVGNSGAGALPSPQFRNSLSDVSANMGEIVAGRAVFTDGGGGAFSWEDYNGHTGAVIGLEGTAEQRGAAYILEGGTVRAKLGYVSGLGSVGTIAPTGWGLWTNNGYFQGEVAASRVTGGTIGGAFIYGGTIRSSEAVVNSSNPGWYADSTGFYGFGTLGLTFKLPTDPADKPVFSSGTILNTVYEVYNASVIRTGTVNPRVQIDSSGIFAYGPTGATKFSVDASTGIMTAVDGVFSGALSASTITGGTVSGSRISGGTVTGVSFVGNTITGNQITGGTVTGALLSGVEIVGGTIRTTDNQFKVTNAGGVFMEAGTAATNSVRWFRNNGAIGPVATIRTGADAFGHQLLLESYYHVGTAAVVVLSVIGSVANSKIEASTYYTSEGRVTLEPFAGSNTRGATHLAGTVVIRGDKIIPQGESTTLGDSDNPFRYLYIRGNDNRKWQLYVSSAGALGIAQVT